MDFVLRIFCFEASAYLPDLAGADMAVPCHYEGSVDSLPTATMVALPPLLPSAPSTLQSIA